MLSAQQSNRKSWLEVDSSSVHCEQIVMEMRRPSAGALQKGDNKKIRKSKKIGQMKRPK